MTTPPLNNPLRLRRVLTELQMSVRQLCRGLCSRTDPQPLRVSVGAMQTLISNDVWPKRTSRELLEKRITAALLERGASELQLVDLFKRYDPYQLRVLATRQKREEQARAKANQTSSDEEESMLLAKQTLSPEARKAFGLFTNPFDGEVTSAAEMFQTGEIRYVREACWQAAIAARFVGVVGESGSGKTTILGDLEERIVTDRKPVVVIRPSVLGMEDNDRKGKSLKSADIQSAICMQLDPLTTVPQTSEKRTRTVARLLEESTQAGNAHLLVIEEAHSLPIPTLQHLKRLHERMRMGRRPMLGILLLGHPELAQKLKRFDVREVAQRCELVHLQPLDGQAQAYLQFRAKNAGKKLEELITTDGLEEIRARLTVMGAGTNKAPISLLYPLALNNLVTAALNVAAELGAPVVNRDVVRAI